jgi:hypothetical protein
MSNFRGWHLQHLNILWIAAFIRTLIAKINLDTHAPLDGILIGNCRGKDVLTRLKLWRVSAILTINLVSKRSVLWRTSTLQMWRSCWLQKCSNRFERGEGERFYHKHLLSKIWKFNVWRVAKICHERHTIKAFLTNADLLKCRNTTQDRTPYSLRHTYATFALINDGKEIHAFAK